MVRAKALVVVGAGGIMAGPGCTFVAGPPTGASRRKKTTATAITRATPTTKPSLASLGTVGPPGVQVGRCLPAAPSPRALELSPPGCEMPTRFARKPKDGRGVARQKSQAWHAGSPRHRTTSRESLAPGPAEMGLQATR